MVCAIVFAAIFALVAIYSRETVAKTPVNPSIAEPTIAKHTKDIDDDNRLEAGLHHRNRRSPGGPGSGNGRKSAPTGTASDRHGVQVGVDRRNIERCSRHSKWQIAHLETAFLRTPYLNQQRRESLAAVLGLRQYQVQLWFQNKRHRQKKRIAALAANVEAANVDAANMPSEMQRAFSMCIQYLAATVPGLSVNSIGHSEGGSRVASPSSGGGLRHNIEIPLPEVAHSASTSGCGVRFVGPGKFDFHHQHQHPSYAEDLSMFARRVQSQPPLSSSSPPNQPLLPPPSPPNQAPPPPSPPALQFRGWRPWDK